jgi:hypothetical protein
VYFDIIDQLLIRYSAFIGYWRKNRSINRTVHQSVIDFEKACNSGEIFHSILIGLGITIKQVRLIKMCLNETYSKDHIGKLCDAFPIQNSLNQGDAFSTLL